jgi:hypothetical protein
MHFGSRRMVIGLKKYLKAIIWNNEMSYTKKNEK